LISILSWYNRNCIDFLVFVDFVRSNISSVNVEFLDDSLVFVGLPLDLRLIGFLHELVERQHFGVLDGIPGDLALPLPAQHIVLQVLVLVAVVDQLLRQVLLAGGITAVADRQLEALVHADRDVLLALVVADNRFACVRLPLLHRLVGQGVLLQLVFIRLIAKAVLAEQRRLMACLVLRLDVVLLRLRIRRVVGPGEFFGTQVRYFVVVIVGLR
jgi:hypothetical protein